MKILNLLIMNLKLRKNSKYQIWMDNGLGRKNAAPRDVRYGNIHKWT